MPSGSMNILAVGNPTPSEGGRQCARRAMITRDIFRLHAEARNIALLRKTLINWVKENEREVLFYPKYPL